jgi:hypothetical protein
VLGNDKASETIHYHVSSLSGGGACVAVRKLADGRYRVEHSRDRTKMIDFTEAEFEAFIGGVKLNEFDF